VDTAANSGGADGREAQWQRNLILEGGDIAKSQIGRPTTRWRAAGMDIGRGRDAGPLCGMLKPEEQPGALEMAEQAWANGGDTAAEINDYANWLWRTSWQQFQTPLVLGALKELIPAGLNCVWRGVKNAVAKRRRNLCCWPHRDEGPCVPGVAGMRGNRAGCGASDKSAAGFVISVTLDGNNTRF